MSIRDLLIYASLPSLHFFAILYFFNVKLFFSFFDILLAFDFIYQQKIALIMSGFLMSANWYINCIFLWSLVYFLLLFYYLPRDTTSNNTNNNSFNIQMKLCTQHVLYFENLGLKVGLRNHGAYGNR
ncbi:hypothetical protein PUN28_002692 [Cardiocondyla obscurior]|uniref:Uncharacterized protein n=1 Tax=Cardiocondyla obscurior TaxID=286306 RepID=A0AAW2GVJ7_9HYME